MVWDGNEVKEGLPPLPPIQGTSCSSLQIRPIQLLWAGGAPALMAHLGKVVLFFSQGLRTGSGGQATSQKDKGQRMPHLNLSPKALSAPV